MPIASRKARVKWKRLSLASAATGMLWERFWGHVGSWEALRMLPREECVEDGNPEHLTWLSDQGLLPLEVVKQQLRTFGEKILPYCV